MTIRVNKNSVGLSTANGWYECKWSNPTAHGTTDLALTSTRTISPSFSTATDTVLGIILFLTNGNAHCDKSVRVDFKRTLIVSPYTVGQTYEVRCRITTSAGRTDDRTLRVQVVER